MSKHYSKLLESKVSSKRIYTGVVDFNVDKVRLINGKTSSREYMSHPGASAILAVCEGNVLFVEQYRYPVHKTTLEIPAGKLKKGQSPLACAKAELSEETGYKASKMKKLLSFNTSVAFSTEVLHIFLATGLKAGKMHLDDDEFVNVKKIPLDKALLLVRKGIITDSKTIIALFYYKTFIQTKAK